MNVTLEQLAPCKKLMRVEVGVEKVQETFKTITQEFRREASLPGFRPGKAPVDMVVRKYGKDIEEEAKRKLISEAYRQAVDEQKLDVIGQPDIEEIQFGENLPLQFAATIEVAPEFELPEYKGIPAQREARTVTDEDVAKALDALRESRAQFVPADRPAATGDVVVVDYTGTCEGQPITELAPTAKGLTEKKAFWIEIGGATFIPGFDAQLAGARAGEQRTVNIDFPADFVTPQLAGKKGVYAVTVTEVRQKQVPALDDELAKGFQAENLEKLKEGIRRDLQNELDYKLSRDVRNQVIQSLLNRIHFDLPETSVAMETRNVVYDIVQENVKRGIQRDAIEQHKDKIYNSATQGAKERLKISFILRKIAEKEDIKVSQEEIGARVQAMAYMNRVPVDKFVKDLRDRNGLIEVFDQLQNEKVMELLEKNAQVTEVPPAPAAPAPGAA